jgi:hypothetical protein
MTEFTVTPPMLQEVKKEYGPGNPHPLYGTDPNILNEFGHTAYPKWVQPESGPAVLAKDENHEKQLMSW